MRGEKGHQGSSRVAHSLSPNRDGFTLIELVLVLFLVVLMVSLSAVFFANTLSSSRLNAAARDIFSSIRQARSLAQIHGERRTVTIDLDAKQFGIEGRALKSIPPDVNIKVTDPFSGEVYTGKYTITAGTTGAVNGGTIVLWNRKKTISIQMDPVVGAVVSK